MLGVPEAGVLGAEPEEGVAGVEPGVVVDEVVVVPGFSAVPASVFAAVLVFVLESAFVPFPAAVPELVLTSVPLAGFF